jgi:tRNA 2-selenouridine synthase
MKNQPTAHLPSDEEIQAWFKEQTLESSGNIEDHLIQTPDISVENLENMAPGRGSIIDVRSPFEYEQDHIPSAINIPLLDNRERHIVGNLYKNRNPSAATQVAHHFFLQKKEVFLQRFSALPSPYYIYCWRGGGRSRFVSSHLQNNGHQSIRVNGGYKSYRARIRHFFEHLEMRTPSILLIAGLTGSGKTDLLKQLATSWPVMDLEAAAQHCGSVFGHIPYNKNKDWSTVPQSLFESRVASVIKSLEHSKGAILTEDEGRRIGRNHIPDPLFTIMKNSPRIWIELPFNVRVDNILNDYFSNNEHEHIVSQMSIALERLNKYIGHEARTQLTLWLTQRDYRAFVEYMLTSYYDSRYSKHPPNVIHVIKANTLQEAIEGLNVWLRAQSRPFSHNAP